MRDENGLIRVGDVRLLIQDALANAERYEAEAAIQRGIAKGLEKLIGEISQSEPDGSNSVSNGKQNSYGNLPKRHQPPARKSNKIPTIKTPLVEVLTDILKANPEGMTKSQLSEILEQKGRGVNPANLSSVLSVSECFVAEKIGPNYFIWKYVGQSKDVEASQSKESGQAHLGLTELTN